MKVARWDRPIRASMLAEDGWRMDAAPYLSGKTEAVLALARLNTEPLASLCAGHEGGIFRGPQHRRMFVSDPAAGVPFLGSSDMLMADLSRLPLQNATYVNSDKMACLQIVPGTSLISCSGTIGRTVYARPDMAHMWSSEHIMKICPNTDRIPSGYLYAYLAGRIGNALVTSGTYGSMIVGLEPQHLADIPVPRLGRLEAEVHSAVQRAAELRAAWQAAIQTATAEVFTAVGLRDITALEWHARHDQDLGYAVRPIHGISFLPLHYCSRAEWLRSQITKLTSYRRLGEVVVPGTLGRGLRFKRIDAAPSHGAKLIGQKDLFATDPEGRFLARFALPRDVWRDEGDIMLAALGTFGEFEVFCQTAMVFGEWKDYVFADNILSIVPNRDLIEPGFLFSFLRSHAAFRLIRCMAVGTKLQVINPHILRDMPVPYPDQRIRTRIHESVMAAFAGRAEADRLERDAIARVERAIDEE